MYRLFYPLNYEKYTKIKTMQTNIRKTKKVSRKKLPLSPSTNNRRGFSITRKHKRRNISRTTDTNTLITAHFPAINDFINKLFDSPLFSTDNDVIKCCNQLYEQRKKLFYPYRQQLINGNCVETLDKMMSLLAENYERYYCAELKQDEEKNYYIEVTEARELEGQYIIALDWLLSLTENSQPLKKLLYCVLKKFSNHDVENPFTHMSTEHYKENLPDEISELKSLIKKEKDKAKKSEYKEQLQIAVDTLDWLESGRFKDEENLYKSISTLKFSEYYNEVVIESESQQRLLDWLLKCNKVLGSGLIPLESMCYHHEDIDQNGYIMANNFIRFIWTKNRDEYLGHIFEEMDQDAMNMGVGGFYFSCIISDKTPYPIINQDYLKYYKLMSFQDEYYNRKSP